MNICQKTYWTSIEFKLMSTHDDYERFKGGFVYAFVKANDFESALTKFKKELNKKHLILIQFEFIEVYENVEWENENEKTHFDSILKEVEKYKDVVMDNYYMFELE